MASMAIFIKPVLTFMVCLLCAGTAVGVHAQTYTRDDYLALIESYVDKTRNIYDGTWAYSYTMRDRETGESVSRRVDPSKPLLESEVLLAENGEPPSTEALAEQEERLQRRLRRQQRAERRSLVDEEREREGDEKTRFLELIIRESVRLVSQDGDLHTLSFRGMEEDRRKIYEHLVGTLVLDTRLGYIRELQVRVTEPFSPYLIMRINAGFFAIRFALEDGVPVQQDATWQLDGHVLYVRDLDRNQTVEWFDISPVTTSTAP